MIVVNQKYNNMKQKTAVEWLMNELDTRGGPDGCSLTWKDLDSLIEQARRMEKDQIIESWNDGNLVGRNGNIILEYDTGGQYFKETYGK